MHNLDLAKNGARPPNVSGNKPHLMIRKILGIATFLSFCFLFSTAQKRAQKGFIINGHIDGIEKETKVYLIDIDAQAFMDSAITNKGNFTLKGHVENPTVCWIRCQSQDAIVMAENTNMKFEASLKNMSLFSETKGGKEQDLQNELQVLQRPYEIVCSAAFDSIMNNHFTDQEHKKRMIKHYDHNQSISQGIYVEFGKRHPNSFLGLDILYRNRQTIGKDSIKHLLTLMSDPIKASGKAQALEIFVHSELAQKGKPFIDFEAQSINGASFKLSSLKGNYILLSFWNAGCTPCRYENRALSKEYDRLKERLAIVSFSTSKNKTAWLKATKDDYIQWSNVSDLAGENSKIKVQYDVQAEPTSYLINKDGIIVEKFIGFDSDFLDKLERLIAQK